MAEAIDLRVWVEKSSLHDMTAAIRIGDEWVEADDAPALSSTIERGTRSGKARLSTA